MDSHQHMATVGVGMLFSPVLEHPPPPPRAVVMGLPCLPACGADGPAYEQPPLALALCKQIVSGLKRKSLIKQLCVYNYVLNYLCVSFLCCFMFA